MRGSQRGGGSRLWALCLGQDDPVPLTPQPQGECGSFLHTGSCPGHCRMPDLLCRGGHETPQAACSQSSNMRGDTQTPVVMGTSGGQKGTPAVLRNYLFHNQILEKRET